jgi:serine/threonine-protein kinase
VTSAPAATVASAPGSATPASARTSAQTTRFGPAHAASATAEAHGVVDLAVAPWGEVYVDGAVRGTAPPLEQLALPAGRHTIEIRNGDRQPFIAQVDVAPDRPQRVAHRFQ